jgi:hypothetical protein
MPLERWEQAAVHSRPVSTVRADASPLIDVLRRMKASGALCRQCGDVPGAILRGGSPATWVCRSCQRRFNKATPIERKRMRLEITRHRP